MRTHRQSLGLIVVWFVLTLMIASGHGMYALWSLVGEKPFRMGLVRDFQSENLYLSAPHIESDSYSFRVFTPSSKHQRENHAENTFPVLLFLHGSGERGSDNLKALTTFPNLACGNEFQRKHPCFVVVPQCPADFNWTSFRRRFNAEFSFSRDPVIAAVEKVLEDPRADANRLYLVGFSMGSYGAWELAAEYPNLFAAVVPIAGGGSVALAERLVDVPIWTAHGSNDKVCPISQTRNLVARLESLNGNIHYSELDEIGHASWRPAIQDASEIVDWMFRQRMK